MHRTKSWKSEMTEIGKRSMSKCRQRKEPCWKCAQQTEPRIFQVLACSMTCHHDELNASQQPRDQTASLCLPSSSRPRHLHNMPALCCLFSWLNPLPRTVFLFDLPSKPIRKCEWLPGQEVQLQGGVGGSLAGWHGGCSSYNPLLSLRERGPSEKDNF